MLCVPGSRSTINETAGRDLTDAERDVAMKNLVAMLREWALKPKKEAEAES